MVPRATWLPARLRRRAAQDAAEPVASAPTVAIDLTKHDLPGADAAVSLVKQQHVASGYVDDEPTDEFLPPPSVHLDDQPTVEIPVIRDTHRRRPHLPKRLRRKPKEIKLPD